MSSKNLGKISGSPLIVVKSLTGSWLQPEFFRQVLQIVAAVGAGLVLGAVVVYGQRLPSEWSVVLIVVTIAPTVALFVRDMDKLLLITMIIDIPLGLDIALANRPGHRGGPAGFLISLMTIALVIGYARWLLRGPASTKLYIDKGITIPALTFLFATPVSAFQATDVWFTITTLFLTLQFVLMYFYLINHLNSWADVRLVVTTLAACLLLESILMLLQFYGSLKLSALDTRAFAVGSGITGATDRVGGTFGGPNVAATFLGASLAITFAALLSDNRIVNKRLAFVAIVLGIMALVMTQSRGGWIATAVALLIIAVQSLRRCVDRRIILRLLGVALVMGIGFSKYIVERFTTDDHYSAESRLWHSELALNVIEEHMFTGIGANNQRFVVDDDTYKPLEMMGWDTSSTTIHNTYLATWVELGLPGLMIFIWLLMAGGTHALTAAQRTKDRYASVVITGFLGALIVVALHMTVAAFTGRRLQFMWVILALIAVTVRLSRQTQDLENLVPQAVQASNAGPASSSSSDTCTGTF
jgi:O-antigen ligase